MARYKHITSFSSTQSTRVDNLCCIFQVQRMQLALLEMQQNQTYYPEPDLSQYVPLNNLWVLPGFQLITRMYWQY